MSRIFINPSDISILEGLSAQRASEIHRLIMDSYGKEKPQKLTFSEYCEYRGVSVEEVTEKIQNERKN